MLGLLGLLLLLLWWLLLLLLLLLLRLLWLLWLLHRLDRGRSRSGCVLVLLSQKDVERGERRKLAIGAVAIRLPCKQDRLLLVLGITPVAH